MVYLCIPLYHVSLYQIFVLAHVGTDVLTYTPHRTDVTLVLVDIGPCDKAQNATQSHEGEGAEGGHIVTHSLPDNTLYNIGLDVAGTDVVMLAPSYVVLQPMHAHISSRDLLHALRAESRPLALVVPMYSHTSQKPDLLPYPAKDVGARAKEQTCGVEQPDRLRLPWEAALIPEKKAIPFSSYEFLLKRTLMPPFAFNVSAGPHGTGFVRFPEELNGVGCLGASILRILAGSGYVLHWQNATMYAQAGDPSTLTTVRGTSSSTVSTHCHCLSGTSTSLSEFASRTNRYLLKAVELRNRGLASVYSRTAAGVAFEQDQLPKKAG